MSVRIAVEVVQPPRVVSDQGMMVNGGMIYELESSPPPVYVVTVEDEKGVWREEIHGDKEAARLFIRGVRAGVAGCGGTVDVGIEWI